MPDTEVLKIIVQAAGIVFATLLALPVTRKAWEEARRFNKVHRRAESEFALKLAAVVDDPSITRYAEELGYAGLIGDRHLSHRQRQMLLALPDAEDTIELYMRTRKLVEIAADERRIDWKHKRHQRPGYRKLAKVGWVALYVGCCAVAFAPWLAWGLLRGGKPMPAGLIGVQIYMAIVFLPLAILCLRSGSLVSDAERLLKRV